MGLGSLLGTFIDIPAKVRGYIGSIYDDCKARHWEKDGDRITIMIGEKDGDLAVFVFKNNVPVEELTDEKIKEIIER